MEKGASIQNAVACVNPRFLLTTWLIAVAMLATAGVSAAQEYPEWFLNPGALDCRTPVVGYSYPAYHADSAAVLAIRDGFINYARQQALRISGGQAFWNTEIGMFWMGSNFVESFDSSRAGNAENILVAQDTVFRDSFIFTLLTGAGCELSDHALATRRVQALAPPAWVGGTPKDSAFHYAVGLAPQYFYELSSWREAEKYACRNLARTILTSVKSVGKIGYQGQEIINEEVPVLLRDWEVAARWMNPDEKIFYVLVRMPKQQFGALEPESVSK